MSDRMFDLFLRTILYDEPKGWNALDKVLLAVVLVTMLTLIGAVYV